jgi:hypothetical protein
MEDIKNNDRSKCVKLIKDFEDCMREFHNNKDYKQTYNECIEKYKKEFKICGFKPSDIY